jgi:hypothetical protein
MQFFLSGLLFSLHILLRKENYITIVLQNGIAGFCSVPRNTIWYRGKAKYGTGRKKPRTSRVMEVPSWEAAKKIFPFPDLIRKSKNLR